MEKTAAKPEEKKYRSIYSNHKIIIRPKWGHRPGKYAKFTNGTLVTKDAEVIAAVEKHKKSHQNEIYDFGAIATQVMSNKEKDVEIEQLRKELADIKAKKGAVVDGPKAAPDKPKTAPTKAAPVKKEDPTEVKDEELEDIDA